MLSAEPVLDLGMDFGPPTPPPVPWRPRARRARLPVLLGLLLFLCGASLTPPPPPLRLVARVAVSSDASVMLAGPDLYVLDLMNGVRAYGLRDGRLRWSAPVVELASETTMTYLAGQVIVSMSDTDATGEHTVAFDARTGSLRWASDFGSAQVIGGALLVQAEPRPPGFNYAGTPQTGSLRILDPRTGTIRWTYGVSENCAVEITTAIVELCPNALELAEISLADGRPSVTRIVPLGYDVNSFQMPRQDRMEEPQFVVGRDTILIAHAARPQPVIDAYALADLRPLWSGRPTTGDQNFQECGPAAMCFISGAAAGTAFDPRTGQPVAAPSPPPAPDHPVLLPVGDDPRKAADVPVFGAGLSVAIPDLHRPAPKFLADYRDGTLTLVEPLPVAAADSCAELAGYLACTTAGGHLAVWQDRG